MFHRYIIMTVAVGWVLNILITFLCTATKRVDLDLSLISSSGTSGEFGGQLGRGPETNGTVRTAETGT